LTVKRDIALLYGDSAAQGRVRRAITAWNGPVPLVSGRRRRGKCFATNPILWYQSL